VLTRWATEMLSCGLCQIQIALVLSTPHRSKTPPRCLKRCGYKRLRSQGMWRLPTGQRPTAKIVPYPCQRH
jgi:hypothetical protein